MLSGIGAKGGKKDLKQTRKNKEEQKKKNLKLKDEKEKTESIKKNEQKKQIQEILQNKLHQTKEEEKQEKKTEEKVQQQIKKVQENTQKDQQHKPNLEETNHHEQNATKKKFAVDTQEITPKQKQEQPQSDVFNQKNNPINQEQEENKTISDISKNQQSEQPIEKEKIESKNISQPQTTQITQSEEENIEKTRQHQEEVLELKVTEELERLLTDNRYELKKLYTELEEIQKETDYIQELEDAETAIGEVERLIDKLNQIKKQLESISESHNLDGIFDLDDNYFSQLVEKYKEQVKDQRVIEDKVSNFKRDEEYISLINKIIDFEKQQEELSQTLEEKRLELEERDKKFEEVENQYLTVEQIKQDIDTLIITSRRYLLEIEEKLKHAISATVKTEIVVKSSLSTLNRTLLFLALFHKNPLMKANIASTIGTITTLKLLQDFLNPKTEEKKYLHYQVTDYTSLITEALNNTYIATTLIQNGKKQIQDIKEVFEKDFKQYSDSLPEYKELLQSLDTIEKELTEKEYNITKIKETMQLEQQINDNKILQYNNKTENL